MTSVCCLNFDCVLSQHSDSINNDAEENNSTLNLPSSDMIIYNYSLQTKSHKLIYRNYEKKKEKKNIACLLNQ